MNNDPIHDMFGNEIHEGDKIVYSASDGRSSVLRRGVVKEVYWRMSSYSTDDEPRVAVDAERFRRRDKSWVAMRNTVTLTFPERIIVVDRSAW